MSSNGVLHAVNYEYAPNYAEFRFTDCRLHVQYTFIAEKQNQPVSDTPVSTAVEYLKQIQLDRRDVLAPRTEYLLLTFLPAPFIATNVKKAWQINLRVPSSFSFLTSTPTF